jgi:hypothetical protein
MRAAYVVVPWSLGNRGVLRLGWLGFGGTSNRLQTTVQGILEHRVAANDLVSRRKDYLKHVPIPARRERVNCAESYLKDRSSW